MYNFPCFVLYAGTLISQSVELTWNYHDPELTDDKIYFGNPHRYLISLTDIAILSTSIIDKTISGELGYFDGLSIQIGDWLSGYEQGGRALRIIDILNATPNSITVVVEDAERYNTFQNRAGNGDASISPGGYIFFRVKNNNPYLQGLDDNNPNAAAAIPTGATVFTDANWAADIIQRFDVLDSEYGLLYNFINHGYSDGQLLKIAKPSDIIPSIVIGTNSSPSVSSGDTARFGNKIVTFPTLSNPQNIIDFLNLQMLGDGNVIASINTDGAIKLTSVSGIDMEIYDISGSTISSGLGLGYLGNGVYAGKLIAVSNISDITVAVVKRTSIDPNLFYIKWLGDINNTHNSPGNAGDIIYINNTGQFTNINSGKVVAVKLNSIIPAITVGVKNATTTDVSLNINQVYVSTSGLTTVDQMVTAINNAMIPNIVASNFNDALKIINTAGEIISIYDFGTAIVDFGIKTSSIGTPEQVLILNAAVSTVGGTFSSLQDVNITSVVGGNTIIWDSTINKWIPGNLSTTLQNLSDVSISQPSLIDGDTLTWVDTDKKWEAKQVATKLSQLTDTNVGSVTDKQVLKYNAITKKWEPIPIDLQFLSDVNITDSSVENGQVLTWTLLDNKWEAKTPITDLSKLTDVNITGITNKQVLRYNSASKTWEPITLGLNLNSDVNIVSPTNGQVLTWVGSDSKWEAKPISIGISSLTDVSAPSMVDGDVLTWVATDSKWEPKAQIISSIETLSDVNIITKNTNDLLKWNGTTWGASSIKLEELSDVSKTPPTNRKILTYNATTSIWGGSSISLEELSNVNIPSPVSGQVLTIVGNSTWGAVSLTLQKMFDVNITSNPNNGDVLTWDSTDNKWEAKIPGAPTVSLQDLSDVTVTDSVTANGSILAWNLTNNKWEAKNLQLQSLPDVNINETAISNNSILTWIDSDKKWEAKPITLSIGSLTDVNLVSPASGQVLTLNGTVWGATSISLQKLIDVKITTPNNGEVLTWDSTDNKWEPKFPVLPLITLQSLPDVNITETATANGSILTWNLTNTKWEAEQLTLNKITDIDLSTLSSNQILKYNSSSTTWVASSNSLQYLDDVTVTNTSNNDGDILSWVSANNKWEAKPGTVKQLRSLTDVQLSTSISDKQVLAYSSTDSKWKETSLKLENLFDINVTDTSNNNGDVLSWNSSHNKWEAKTAGLYHLIDDTTPTLGGNLNVGSSNIITSNSGVDIAIQSANNVIIQSGTGYDVIIDGGGNQARLEAFTNSDIVISGGPSSSPGTGGNVILQGGHAISGSTPGFVKVEDNRGTSIIEFHAGSSSITANYMIINNGGSNDPVVITAGPSTSNVDILISPPGTGKVILSQNKWPIADGNSGQALLTDGNGNLYWGDGGNGSSGGSTSLILENPTDGSYNNPRITGGKNPAVTNWITGTTKIADAIDDLNEILGMLLPSAPANLNTKTITLNNGNNVRDGISIKFASGAINNCGNVIAGQQIYTIFTSNAATNIVTNFGSGNSGILTANLNGSNNGQITLTTSNNIGTNQSLQIIRNDDYPISIPGFYKDLDALITGTIPEGANSYQLIHSETGSTNLLYFVYDSFTTSPIIDETSISQNTANLKYSSSVPHYDANSILNVNLSAHNLSGMTYLDTNVIEITSNPIIGNQITLNASDMPSTISGILTATVGVQTLTNESFTISGNNFITSNISIRGRNSYVDGNYTNDITKILVMSGTITPTDISPIQEMNILVNNLGTIPTGANQYAQRIGLSNNDTPNDDIVSATTWNSQNSLPLHEAAIIGGILSHNQVNYGNGAYLPIGSNLSSNRSGSQYCTFYFRRSSVSEFNINVTGTYDACWIKLPGITNVGSSPNGWWDMTTAYTGRGIPGSNGSNGCAVGNVMNKNSGIFKCTFGQENSSNSTSNYIVVRFKLIAGNSITNLSFFG